MAICDYSLYNRKSRPAVVGEKLITRSFGTGTNGFTGADEVWTQNEGATAVCLLPGTEVAFDNLPETYVFADVAKSVSKVARFRQVDKDLTHTHHDALEFPDGAIVKLSYLKPGQTCSVLQLPAAPKTVEEAKEQERLEVVG